MEKEKYRLVLEHLPDGFAYHQLLTDSKKNPIGYKFLEVNPAFEKMTGLKKEQVIGKTITEILLQNPAFTFDWVGAYDQVVADGESTRLVHYLEATESWYEITAYSDTSGYFATIFRDITENKHSQDILKENEESLFVTLHSIGDGVIATDLHRKITRMNPQAEKLTGWSFQEAAGQPLDKIFRIINAKTGKPAFNPVQHVLKTGEILKLANDTALISRDGNSYQIADSAAPIRDSEGKISGAVLVFSDVTEQYLAKKALEETTERLKHTLRATKTGIDVIDKDFNLLYVDNLWKDIYGAYEGRKCYEYFKNRSGPCENCGVPRALKTKQPSFSEQVLPKEGNRVIECHTVPFQNEQGEWLVAEFKTDITRLKQAEKALKESENRYRTIVENINDTILIHDFKGRITDLNDTAYRMFGYKRDELLGAGLAKLRASEEQIHSPEHLVQLLQDDKLLFEKTLMHKNGTPIPVEISAKIVSRDGDGLIQAFIRDITERRKAEQQIAAHTSILEELYQKLDKEINKAKKVHERTFPKRLPEIDGVSFAAHYQPAERLGGDFYDIEQTGKKVVIYLSDVTGHGVDGAMLSVFVKHTIKGFLSFSPERDIRPEKILRHLSDQFLQKNLPPEYFICIFLAVLDLETRELVYTAAGFQDAPLAKMGNGRQLQLVSRGLFLSPAFSDELLNLQEEKIRLTPGTTIFFNTDGLTEHCVKGNYYGRRLPDVFYKNSHLPPELIKQAVCEDFRNFNNGTMQGHDDITFLILQLDPGPKKTKRLELASDFAELDHLRETVSEVLGENRETDLFSACLHELVSNAMEHGNRFDRDKTVFVELTITDWFIQGSVEDQGKGFGWREQIRKPLELEGISERGRGIAMARICSKHLFYNDKGNRATFIIRTEGGKNNHAC